MGLLKILKKLKKREREIRVLILGLDNAGVRARVLRRVAIAVARAPMLVRLRFSLTDATTPHARALRFPRSGRKRRLCVSSRGRILRR